MHRPEAWGVLQFADLASELPLPLEGMAERDLLMNAYYAQKSFLKQHGRFATADELGLTEVQIYIGPVGWQGSVSEWLIDETSLINRKRPM
jgi:hypothetical protein